MPLGDPCGAWVLTLGSHFLSLYYLRENLRNRAERNGDFLGKLGIPEEGV